uniref:Cytochrome b5 heme-binding domain-containing protein n=1 Tax=Leersia perrieri TaxID=77586 RepID=A0A0D9XL79_9ORYZ
MAAVAELWETLKQAIVAYTGLSPAAFFTAVAVAAALYHVVSGIFAAPPPPPPRPREEPEAEPLPPPVQLGEVSEEELKQYDGSDPKKPLLMAIKGQIYDVTQSRMFYGPGGPYALFAGKDASRALAKMSFEPQDLTGDISGLGPFELDALQDWEYKFMGKYVKVGTVKKTVPVEDGNTSTSPEATETAAAAEPEKVPTTEGKPREVSTEEVKEKEEAAVAAPDESAKESETCFARPHSPKA